LAAREVPGGLPAPVLDYAVARHLYGA
jgi:hypothetical protein